MRCERTETRDDLPRHLGCARASPRRDADSAAVAVARIARFARLLEYELWTQIHARKLGRTHGDAVRTLLGEVALLELSPVVLARALEPFPVPMRTLDALHMASVEFLRRHDRSLALASYDSRLLRTARALKVRVFG